MSPKITLENGTEVDISKKSYKALSIGMEAVKRFEYQEALARVNRYIRENDLRIPKEELDWEDEEQGKYNISYNYFSSSHAIEYYWSACHLPLIGNLRSYEAAEQVIDNCKKSLDIIFSY